MTAPAPVPRHAATEAAGDPRRNAHLASIKKQNPIMQFFDYSRLPEHVRQFSETLCLVAKEMDEKLPPSSEKHAGLRKLLEAKDCFTRAKFMSRN